MSAPEPIRDLTGSIVRLEQWAVYLDRADPNLSASDFVWRAFAPTTRITVPSRAAANKFEDGTLGLWEVLGRAKQWDKEGRTTLAEFVSAIACEAVGNEREQMSRSALADLLREEYGKEADQHEVDIFVREVLDDVA